MSVVTGQNPAAGTAVPIRTPVDLNVLLPLSDDPLIDISLLDGLFGDEIFDPDLVVETVSDRISTLSSRYPMYIGCVNIGDRSMVCASYVGHLDNILLNYWKAYIIVDKAVDLYYTNAECI